LAPSSRNSFPARQAVLDALLQIRQADKLGQPFLLAGPPGSGKENTALEFARLLNCAGPEHCRPESRCQSCVKALSFQHPDIRWIGPAPAAIKESEVRDLLAAKMEDPFFQPDFASSSFVSIGDPESPGPLTIRSLIHFLRRMAFQSAYKVAIVADSQRMNQAAANAFLKTLEEPPPLTVIMLLTTGTEGMLPTILSRCQKIRFEPWPEDELTAVLSELVEADARILARAVRTSDGNARRALAQLQPEAELLGRWAGHLFEWIGAGNRAMAAVAADEVHRGLMGHTVLPADAAPKALEARETAQRRSRAMQLCELLNLLYSDTVGCKELGACWAARLPAAASVVTAAADRRTTASLLADMELIEAARLDIDRNINIGLVMAVLFEGLAENAEKDQSC
jgi:DNA polymerase III delta prime subunit